MVNITSPRDNPRFVITNLKQNPKGIYEQIAQLQTAQQQYRYNPLRLSALAASPDIRLRFVAAPGGWRVRSGGSGTQRFRK